MKKFRVKELAEDRKLTQEQLAEKVRQKGVSVSLGTIQALWQNRQRGYQVDTLIAVAKALGVSIEDLYNDPSSLYTDEHIRKTGHAARELASA